MKNYVQRSNQRIARSKEAASKEAYVELPLDTTSSDQPAPVDPDALVEALVKPDGPRSIGVYLCAEGGRGKSALMRELTLRLFARFETSGGRSPLPVTIDLTPKADEALAALLERSLGEYAVSSALITHQLRNSDLIFVLDGLTESGVSAEKLESFVREYENSARILVSMRPNRALEKAMRGCSTWHSVTPRLLDEASLSLFVDRYAPGVALNDRLKHVCRTPQGSYVPIYVRLAIELARENRIVDSVGALYAAAIHRLVATPELERDAIDIAFQTYWLRRQRRFPYRDALSPERARLLPLRAANLLWSADEGAHLSNAEPQFVRFLHDSLQTYLAARGLLADDLWKQHLLTIAGDPTFLADGGSDLFTALIEILPPEVLRSQLVREAQKWAEEYDEDLTRREVLESTPELVRADLFNGGRDLTTGALIREVLRLCLIHDAAGGKHASAFFSHLAPRVFTLRANRPAPGAVAA